jgi:hypothetical protein
MNKLITADKIQEAHTAIGSSQTNPKTNSAKPENLTIVVIKIIENPKRILFRVKYLKRFLIVNILLILLRKEFFIFVILFIFKSNNQCIS